MSEPTLGSIPDNSEGSTRIASTRRESTRLILLAARLMFMALVLATPALVVGSLSSSSAGEPFPVRLVIGLTLATGDRKSVV